MDDRYAKPLSAEQKAQLMPALDKVDLALDELDTQLARFGVADGEALGTFRCLVPGCRCLSFIGSKVPMSCKTPGCGHRFTRHDVF